MSKLNTEKNIQFHQSFNRCSIEIGYDYSDFEEDSNLIWITFLFWTIDFAWKPLRKKEWKHQN